MLIKALFFAILLYFIIRAVLNLIAAVHREVVQPGRIDPRRQPEAPPIYRAPREAVSRRSKPDIEDARWEDIT